MKTTSARKWLLLALWCVALFVWCLALNTRHNDFPHYYHPDEPGKVEQLISGDWNLHHPMLLLDGARLTMAIAGTERDKQAIVEIGRTVSAIFISAAVVVLSLLGWRWRGWGAALGVGGILALHHQLFELSHYLKEDSALLFGVATAVLATWLYSERPSLPRAAFLGLACALAISGKYIGALTLLLAVPALLRYAVRRGPEWTAFLATLLVAFALVNWPILTDFPTFWESLSRETDYVVHGQKGMTRSVPHAQYWSIFLDNSTPVMWIFLLIFLIARWRKRHCASPGERIISAFPFLFALALSFSPKSNDRYFLPASALLAVLAIVGAGDLAAWLIAKCPRRATFSIAALALIAGQLPAWTNSRPGWLGYDRAFQRDDNQELIEWLRTELPPDAVIAKDNRIALPNPERRKHADRVGIIPQKVIAEKYAADIGTLEEMRAAGITHAAVSEMDYGKFFLQGLRPKESEREDFERRRDFYQRLFWETKLVFSREKSTVLYLHPGIRVYEIASGERP